MRNISHAIFDLDGTLIDSLPGIEWSIGMALAEVGLPPISRDLKPLIGPPIRAILEAVTGISEAHVLDRLEGAFRSSYDSLGWRMTRCQEGAAELLSRLDESGIGLWVFTNKPGAAAHKILGALNIAGFFREVACRDSRIPAFASKAEVLRDLVGRHALEPAACLVVGDTLDDCQAAGAAGIACAIVPHGYGAWRDHSVPAGCLRVRGWQELAERIIGSAAPNNAALPEILEGHTA